MNVINNSLEFYIDKLKTNEKFSFTRWGDGEWSCVFGAKGHNCDKHQYFESMSEELTRALVDDKGYYKATWPMSVPMLTGISHLILGMKEKYDLKDNWVDARVWEESAMQDTIGPLIKQLEKMDFVVVSEKSKKDLTIDYKDFIEIPVVDCYLEKENIKNEIKRLTEKYDKPIFGLSASMATNVIVDELFEEIGDKCWMIDFGSIWEPYIGKVSRSYHNRYINKEIK